MIDVAFTQGAGGGLMASGACDTVVCLDLRLSMGDITTPLSDLRAEYLQSTMLISGLEFSDVGKDLVGSAQNGLALILDAVQRGEPVRCWYSGGDPDEYCGFCHLLSVLPQNAEVWAVELPALVTSENHITRYSGWDEVESAAFSGFLDTARRLPKEEIRYFAALWRERVRENGPLRAMVNGSLQTVGADFYDSFILRELNAVPEVFHEAQLIGNVLGRYGLGIRDSLAALRLEEWIHRGWLVPVTVAPENVPIYHRMLRKLDGLIN